MERLFERMLRAARLDPALYEEVEADRGALGQATVVVLMSSLAAGIGAIPLAGASGLLVGTIGAVVGWYVWALLTWFIGTRILPEPQTRADIGELLRTIGFSSAPGVIRVLGVLGPLAKLVAVVASIWMLAAMIVAVRQALDYTSTWRAIGVCLVGFLIQAILAALLLSPMAAH